METRHYVADIAIIGGGVGGCAAAIAALEAGRTVILTDETDWIGGQLTSQLVPPDEHGWIEQFGRTATYAQFREAVREYYRVHYPLTTEAAAQPYLNPGNGWVSPLCHEPRVALAVLNGMLAPFRRNGRLQELLGHRPVAVTLDSPEVVSTVGLEGRRGGHVQVKAKYFLDATELGDLLALAGAEFVTGQEARTSTGEPSAPLEARPDNVQAFSWCFAMEHREGENHVGAPPEDYAYWRNYRAPIKPTWPDRWLSWAGMNPRTLQPVQYRFAPHAEPAVAFAGLWTYRRVLDRDQFSRGAFASDVVVVNWPMIDYLPGSLLSDSRTMQEVAAVGAKRLSLAALFWMQTEAPRPDGGIGWPGLRLRADVAGTSDGLAKAPYIRESRRIVAECIVREQDIAASHRPLSAQAAPFEDTVGVGYYRIDLHPTCGGDNYLDVNSLPFQIPLGALIPVRMENLLPAAKNIGTTHITNGCYRVHPVEWNIGESAGALAAFCIEKSLRPRTIRSDPDRRRAFQQLLEDRGVELRWPDGLNLDRGDPHYHMRPRPVRSAESQPPDSLASHHAR